ncbi:MAG: DUF6491 family protein [Woeseiaceae bacterium]
MKRSILVLIVALLAGCAAQPDSKVDDAIEDFVAVSQLEELDSIKSREQFGISELSERYILLTTRKDTYLARFTRRCYELNENQVTPDIRFDRWTLRARFDTIRGCRIEKFFAIDAAQAEELEMLAMSRSPERG